MIKEGLNAGRHFVGDRLTRGIRSTVGAMIGIEQAVLPLLAETEFGLASKTAILSIFASFGIVKALANLFAGRLSDRIGRKGVLVAGVLADALELEWALVGWRDRQDLRTRL